MFPSILIVDDEPSILQSLSGLLSDEGFEVITASNGYEALKTIDDESPDLVLLDIWMPGMDGIETLKEIKKGNPFVQVIIITGHGTIETAVKATKLGAFDFIEKPCGVKLVLKGEILYIMAKIWITEEFKEGNLWNYFKGFAPFLN